MFDLVRGLHEVPINHSSKRSVLDSLTRNTKSRRGNTAKSTLCTELFTFTFWIVLTPHNSLK